VGVSTSKGVIQATRQLIFGIVSFGLKWDKKPVYNFRYQNSIILPILFLLQPGLEQNRRNDRIKSLLISLFWLNV